MNSIAKDILELVELANALAQPGEPQIKAKTFQHVVTGQGQRIVPDTADIRLALFTVPANAAYVATYVSIRTFFNSVVANREPYPFTELDQRGYGSLRFRVNGSYLSTPNTNYLLYANHPFLRVFQSGAQVELIVNRSDAQTSFAGFPSVVNIAYRLNLYSCRPAAVADRFTGVQTNVIAVPANQVLL